MRFKMIAFAAGLFIGANIGFVVFALCVIAKRGNYDD